MLSTREAICLPVWQASFNTPVIFFPLKVVRFDCNYICDEEGLLREKQHKTALLAECTSNRLRIR